MRWWDSSARGPSACRSSGMTGDGCAPSCSDARSSAAAPRSPDVDDPERLRSLGADAFARFADPLADTILELVRATQLADVFPEGGDLDVDRLGDVDPRVRPVAPEQVEPPDLVRLQPFVDGEVRERHRIAGGWVDRVDGRHRGLAVVRVLD